MACEPGEDPGVRLGILSKKDLDFRAWHPIAEGGRQCGVNVLFTDDERTVCDVAIVVGNPNRFATPAAKTTVVASHALDQYLMPEKYSKSFWCRFDYGILPSAQLEQAFQKAQHPFAIPKFGVWTFPLPVHALHGTRPYERRSDGLAWNDFIERKGNRRVVLLAPGGDYDWSQKLMAVEAVLRGSDVMLVYRPGPWVARAETHPMAEGLTAPVPTAWPNEFDILDLVEAADFVLSDESSVLLEAAALGVTAVQVADWPIAQGRLSMRHYPAPIRRAAYVDLPDIILSPQSAGRESARVTAGGGGGHSGQEAWRHCSPESSQLLRVHPSGCGHGTGCRRWLGARGGWPPSQPRCSPPDFIARSGRSLGESRVHRIAGEREDRHCSRLGARRLSRHCAACSSV